MTTGKGHPKIRITYFDVPGLVEGARLQLVVSGVPFEDNRLSFKEWPSVKPTTPFGNVPVAEFDGKILAQNGAIERYIARMTGLMPEDSWEAAQADQAVLLLKDIQDPMTPTNRLPSTEEKIKARQAVVAEVFPGRFKQLAGLLASNGGEFFAGSKLSWADLSVFAYLSLLVSGFFDGIPKSVLDPYPELLAWRNKIALIPAVRAYYARYTDGYGVAFRPDADQPQQCQ